MFFQTRSWGAHICTLICNATGENAVSPISVFAPQSQHNFHILLYPELCPTWVTTKHSARFTARFPCNVCNVCLCTCVCVIIWLYISMMQYSYFGKCSSLRFSCVGCLIEAGIAPHHRESNVDSEFGCFTSLLPRTHCKYGRKSKVTLSGFFVGFGHHYEWF